MMLGANALGWAFLGQGYAGPATPTPPITNVKGYAKATDRATSGAKAGNS